MIKVRISGHDTNNATLRRLSSRRLRRPGRKAVAEGLRILAEEMRARAPVDTGAVRDSIEVQMHPGRSPSGEVVVGGNGHQGETYYAMFIEFGTVNMPARPFMRPAADAARRRIGRAVAVGLKAGPDPGV